ncbi:uridine kinase family protein [Amycolatopsis cihanbeyliensis]|uniref:Uridine kinase n=1 Tax=Amycolatopsis cihanbeyliensis TaxID=1128664 RepID=A0A542DMR1_AMYCI|nr:uridine kinase [Amycolatopsis cihanbeyliensis]TQJ04382.1 uridine kinase [Amycolatopsis cihanbeyliensis]
MTGPADAVLAAPPRLGPVRVLAIDGPSGSGKSTLAAAVRAELRARGVRVALVGTDDFATWTDPVSWWPRLAEGVLARLAEGEPARYRRMDWATGTPRLGDWVEVPVPEVLVLEGVSAGRASIRPSLSVLWWLPGPDPATRLERAVAREGEGSRGYLQDWQAFEKGWFVVDAPDETAFRWMD